MCFRCGFSHLENGHTAMHSKVCRDGCKKLHLIRDWGDSTEVRVHVPGWNLIAGPA